ncbi:hypothetical protein ACF1FX_35840 [Streptomyces sp. NPDC014646]|uniref:hypothetical protein n=1 Tax=unclassified Streptomyces TaxID=2593676 RepID=UPI0036FC028F
MPCTLIPPADEGGRWPAPVSNEVVSRLDAVGSAADTAPDVGVARAKRLRGRQPPLPPMRLLRN